MNRYIVAQMAFGQEMEVVNNNWVLPFVSTHLDRIELLLPAELAKQEAQMLTNCTRSK